jgi:hypothetical protein
MFLIFFGGARPKAIWIIRQIILAKGHSIKRCCTNSLSSQKQHFVSPSQFLFFRLTLVTISFLWMNHIKILIFYETFIFQMYVRRYFVSLLIMSRYIDLTVYPPDLVRPQTKISFSFDRLICIRRCTKCNQRRHLTSVNVQRDMTQNSSYRNIFEDIQVEDIPSDHLQSAASSIHRRLLRLW